MRWLLLAVGLAVMAGVMSPVAVAQEILDRDPDFVAGRAALEDGFYELAALRLEAFVNSTIVKRKKANASVFLFRAWHGLGHYQRIEAWLDENWKLGAGTRYESAYHYWFAQAKYSLGNYGPALDYLRKFESLYPNDEFLPYVIRLRALVLRDSQQLTDSLKDFARYDADFAGRDDIPANLLDWAGVLIQLKKKEEAGAKLQELASRYPDHPASRQARLWLGQEALERKRPEEAASWLTPLAQDAGAEAPVRAQAWFALARSAVNQGQLTNALHALAQGEILTTNEESRVEARIDQARLLMKLNRLAEAVTMMDQTVFTLASQPQAAKAQLELSDLLRAQGQFEKAADAYQRFLESFTDAVGQRHALYSKAWCLWELHRYAEAASTFEKAYQVLNNQLLREQALVKSADAYFMNAQYRLAAAAYEKAMTEFATSPTRSHMMYQAAESYARVADTTNAIRHFRAVVDLNPEHHIAQSSLMRLAQFYTELREWKNAFAAYDEFLVRFSGSERYGEALLNRGLLHYRLGAYGLSLADYERLLSELPGTPWAEQAYFMRAWSYYQMGDVTRALQIAQQFLTENRTSKFAADVLFWLAEHEFNMQNYGVAETNFLSIATIEPTNHLADKAIYWAGRSAAEQKAHRRAIDHMNQLIRVYTNSPLIPEARFAQGDALTEISDFAGAILAFDEIVKKYPAHPLVVRAMGRIGDCQYTLGVDRRDRYQDAVVSLRAALSHPMLTKDVAAQVEYKLALSYERLGLTSEALNHYLNVMYGWLASRDEGIPIEEVWFVRSALSAADLRASAQAWDDVLAIYQRVVDSGITAGADAMIRIDRIKQQRQKTKSTTATESSMVPAVKVEK